MSSPPVSTSLSELVHALNGGVSAPEWETLVANAMVAGGVDEESALAFRQLRARLDEASRREGLLRLLHETATDLIAIRDLEAVLKAIVRRTRALIGSDIAYLSLNDYERNESYIRVTDGATTVAFRNIRIPLGGGVLGAVATGSSPAQSADYPNDTTKTHFAENDAAVIGEGVKAIMGVPLLVEGRVIGALLVGDRRAHVFGNSDIALMESIAAHAAVALENARLFTDMVHAVDQLNDAQRENLSHVDSLESLSEFDQRLMETLADDDILSKLHTLLTETFEADVWILSPDGEPLRQGPPVPVHSLDDLDEAGQASVRARAPISFPGADGTLTVMAAVAGDQHLASLVTRSTDVLRRKAALDRSALVLSAAMLFERTLQDAQYRLQRELIEELLEPKAEISESLRLRARRFGITDDIPLIVRVAAVADENRPRALASLRENAPHRRAIVAVHDSYICVIEPQQSTTAKDCSGAYMIDVLRRYRVEMNVGSSAFVTGLDNLPAAFREARSVHDALTALGRTSSAGDRAALGTAGMLLSSMDSDFAEQLLNAHIGPLLEYDVRRGTELVLTAWTYLESDSSHAIAASHLHIHHNTMRQRVERIGSILGAGWRNGGKALDVHIALQIWRLRTRSAFPSLPS
jgi:sugar diacid utilization regulator